MLKRKNAISKRFPLNRHVFVTLFAKSNKSIKCNSPTGIRTRVVWVKTTYPDQLDYWGFAPAGNQTRVSSVAGTYTITVLPAHAAHHVAEVYIYFFISVSFYFFRK